MNALYYGNNLDILRRYIKDDAIDLIYLDPPFNSKATYNVLFGERNGSKSVAQIKAFEDTWQWDQAAAEAYYEIVEGGGSVADALRSFRLFLGDSDMLAYLSMIAPRLVEIHRVLKPTGSVYLHCDPTASHFLKLLMDAIFGGANFQNEIVWHYTGGGRSKRYFSRKHDVIFWYSKTSSVVFNIDEVRVPYNLTSGYAKTGIVSRAGKRYMPHPGGTPVDDVWDIPIINPMAKERLGYPTQKPESLLQRIVRASSNPGDLVMDPFCGCGTTIAVAQRLGRPWIGIDITHLAITLVKHRLHDAFGDKVSFRVVGEPVSLSGAKALAEQDRFQFELWALGLVGARPTTKKKGADKGVDGRLYFHDEKKGKTKQIVISVKSGHVSVAYVRDLRGVIEREEAQIGVLITLQEPTRPMASEAASAGLYDSPGWGRRYPRLQIITVSTLLQGTQIQYPARANMTFKKAPKAHPQGPQIRELPGV